MSYSFKPFSKSSFKATKSHWLNLAEDGWGFRSSVERLFDDAEDKLIHQDGKAVFFGVFEEKTKYACALCEIVVMRRGIRNKWVKMLNLHLSPDLEAHSGESHEIFLTSMTGSSGLQMEHNANILKIYGRTNEQLELLKTLVKFIAATDAAKEKKFEAKIEGRFLTIESPQLKAST